MKIKKYQQISNINECETNAKINYLYLVSMSPAESFDVTLQLKTDYKTSVENGQRF